MISKLSTMVVVSACAFILIFAGCNSGSSSDSSTAKMQITVGGVTYSFPSNDPNKDWTLSSGTYMFTSPFGVYPYCSVSITSSMISVNFQKTASDTALYSITTTFAYADTGSTISAVSWTGSLPPFTSGGTFGSVPITKISY